MAAYRAANREKARTASKEWHAKNKEAQVEINRARANAWYWANKDRRREYHRANPDKVRQWRHKRRTAKGTFTAAEVRRLHGLQRGRCAACSVSLKTGYHCDHVVPIHADGTNDILNIQLLCPSCNLRKGKKDPIEFAASIGRLL
jgi:5-methylcytosine-specific restriction endonuclease McrA